MIDRCVIEREGKTGRCVDVKIEGHRASPRRNPKLPTEEKRRRKKGMETESEEGPAG